MHKKRPANSGSDTLNASQNEALFACLPFDCYSRYAAVAEVLEWQPNKRWIQLHCGVLALVKDYENRAYFLRAFDIENRKVLWSEKMYKNFTAAAFPHCVNVLTFESGDGRIFGLNFAHPIEATKFKGYIDKQNEPGRKTRYGGTSGAPPAGLKDAQQRPLPQAPQLNGLRLETGLPSSPPPPPPPPGLLSNGAPPPSADLLRVLPTAQLNRGSLLAEIQAGKALQSVDSTNTNTKKLYSNVMKQIKAGGIQLKRVDMSAEEEKRRSTEGGQNLGGMAGMARAIDERRDHIDSDSDSDEFEENDEWSDS